MQDIDSNHSVIVDITLPGIKGKDMFQLQRNKELKVTVRFLSSASRVIISHILLHNTLNIGFNYNSGHCVL